MEVPTWLKTLLTWLTRLGKAVGLIDSSASQGPSAPDPPPPAAPGPKTTRKSIR